MNSNIDWLKEVPFPVTICDEKGIIIYMNDSSIQMFASDGGMQLLGKSLFDCHPEPSRSKLLSLLENHEVNTYLTTINAVPTMVHEVPWSAKGKFMGYMEILISLPESLKL